VKCPHCLDNFFEAWRRFVPPTGATKALVEDVDGAWAVEYCRCPGCKRLIFRLCRWNASPAPDAPGNGAESAGHGDADSVELVRPRGMSRAALPPEVPPDFASAYREACEVLALSPRASAALSRRCLQRLLVEVGGARGKDLSAQIEHLLDSKVLPVHLAEGIDTVRNIGHFSAHANKSQNTGEITDVEAGEADWTLDILESLFDFYFVQPARLKTKRDSLNEKLKDAGAPPTE